MRQNGLIRDGLEFGNFRLYPSERLLLREGRRIAITPRVLDLLILLVGNPGELVDKETILDSIWGDTVVEEGNINRTVSTLRRQLGTQPNGNGYIETVPKIGYRFIAPVRTVLDQSPAEITSPLRSKAVWLLFPLAAFVLAGLILLFLWWSGPGELATKVLSGGETEPRRLTSEPGRYAYPTWADNDRIRFSYSGRNGRVERYIMDANGQNQQRIDPFAGRVSETLSPDGKRVYYWKQNDRAVYLADADGRNEKKLQFEPGSIAWSPDATKIVIQSIRKSAGSESANLLVYDPVLDTSAPVTEGTAVDADPSWSPDSKQIVFNSNRDGNFEIYLMNADGSNVRRLTNHPAWESHPAFSPDGTQIVFNSNREGDNYDVYLMNVDGSGLKKLTTWGSDEEIGPGCWSPDGTRIALVSNRYGDNDIYVLEVEPYRPQLLLADEKLNVRAAAISPDSTVVVYEVESGVSGGELRIYDLATKETRVLTKTVNGSSRPAWSPDGKRIVFQNKVDGVHALFLIDADGSDLTRLTNDQRSDSSPSWSPDGKQIVFIAESFGMNQLYTIDVETREQHPFTPQKGWEADPSWSPDGTKIAFSCDRLDSPGSALDICVRDVDGRNERRLFSHRQHDVQPVWSPDGSRLAFVAVSDGNPEVYLVNADGTGLTRLTRNPADDSIPRWSPDGTKIIFNSNREGKFAIYSIEF